MSDPHASGSEDVSYPDAETLEIRRRLPGPIQKIWDHLVKDELRRKWLCGGQVASEIGGAIEFDFDHRRLSNQPPPERHKGGDTAYFVGRVLAYDPPHHLHFTWPSPGELSDTEVAIWLTEKGDQVELVLRHTRLGSDGDRLGASAGWHAHLDLFNDLVHGRKVRDFWQHFETMDAHYRRQMSESEPAE